MSSVNFSHFDLPLKTSRPIQTKLGGMFIGWTSTKFVFLFQLEIHHRTKRGKGAKCFFLIFVCGAFILQNFHHFDEFCFFMFLIKFYLWNMLTYMYFVLLLPFTRYKMVNMWLVLKIEISLIVYDALLQWMRWWWCLFCTRPTGLVGFLAHLAKGNVCFCHHLASVVC
jgi:hypothetical protein